MESLLLKNGSVIDPASGRIGHFDLLVREGKIERVGQSVWDAADRVIDLKGKTVMPGLVDLHVHLRDPGQTHKETIRTGTMAAARGGVTSLCAMGNTTPPVDSPEMVGQVLEIAKRDACVRVFPVGTLTKGLAGEERTDLPGMRKAGAAAFSEDGKSVPGAGLLYRAMETAASINVLVFSHCEERELLFGGVMNEDANSARLKFPGIRNCVEDVISSRNMILAEATGCRLHLCHNSTKGSVEMIRFAKKRGISVTAEVCPHHFALTSDDIPGDDANYKMNPPLRTRSDAEALIEGLRDGTIDCISTDHAPHAAEEKALGFMKAPFGIAGLETSMAVSYTHLVRTGLLTLSELVEKMSVNPARILGIEGGTLAEGSRADIAVFDFENEYEIRTEEFLSKGRNTPFAGKRVYGRCLLTVCGGRIVWEEPAAIREII